MDRTGIGAVRLYFLILPGVSAPDPFGAVLMFLSGFSWGCFSLFARGVPDPVAANASNFLVCLLPVGLINLLIGHPFETAPAGVLLAVISGGIATGFGYIFWYLAVRDLPVTHAATVQLSLPALVALGGVVFFIRANHREAAGREHGDVGRYRAGAGTAIQAADGIVTEDCAAFPFACPIPWRAI